MSVPPIPPSGSSGGLPDQPLSKEQMEDEIQQIFQQLFGGNATTQSPTGHGESSSYLHDMKHLIERFDKAKNWNEKFQLYQAITLKFQVGDSEGPSQNSSSDFPPT